MKPIKHRGQLNRRGTKLAKMAFRALANREGCIPYVADTLRKAAKILLHNRQVSASITAWVLAHGPLDDAYMAWIENMMAIHKHEGLDPMTWPRRAWIDFK